MKPDTFYWNSQTRTESARTRHAAESERGLYSFVFGAYPWSKFRLAYVTAAECPEIRLQASNVTIRSRSWLYTEEIISDLDKQD